MSWTPATAQELRARVWKARGWYVALTLSLGYALVATCGVVR